MSPCDCCNDSWPEQQYPRCVRCSGIVCDINSEGLYKLERFNSDKNDLSTIAFFIKYRDNHDNFFIR